MPTMIRKNHGHIVNIASSTGLVGINKLTEYCASKFGVVGFTEVLSYELIFGGHDGVHTTLVCPSYVETGMFEGCKMRYDCYQSTKTKLAFKHLLLKTEPTGDGGHFQLLCVCGCAIKWFEILCDFI